MTVPSSQNKIAYNGNNATVTFNVPFYFLVDEDLQVYVAGALKAQPGDYTVSGAGNPAGGSITFAVAPATGTGNVIILRKPDLLQETDYQSNDPFPAESHERALDKLTMIAQSQQEEIDRSIKVSVDDTRTPEELLEDIFNSDTSAAASADAAAASAAAALVSENNAAASEEFVADAVAQAVDGEKNLFVGGTDYTIGVTTSLVLSSVPAKSGTVEVFWDGVYQDSTEWALVGDTITFTGPITATEVEVAYNIPSQFVGLSEADLTVLGNAQAAAQAAQTAAELAEVNAQIAEANAEAAQFEAEAARDAAQLTKGIWPNTAAGIGNGVADVVITSGGTGGANGTFSLAFSGGTQVLAPAGEFTVVGGVVVSVLITYPGYYSAGTPALSFAASSGLTGTNITAVMAPNTIVNEYFSVPVFGADDSLILYRVDAGPVATEVTRYPSAARVRPLTSSPFPGSVLSVEDSAGFPCLVVWENGEVRIQRLTTDLIDADTVETEAVVLNDQSIIASPATPVFSLEDARGFRIFEVLDSGSVKSKNFDCESVNGVPFEQILAGSGSSGTNFSSQGNFEAEIVMVISYGQSNAIGVEGNPAISTTQRFDNLMFAGGVRTNSLGVGSPLGSFVPLIESDTGGTSGETVVSGLTEAIKELVFTENNISSSDQTYQLIGTAVGGGGQPITGLEKGSSLYSTLLNHVTQALAVCQTLGKTFKVGAVFWTQGESDTDGVAYLAKFKQLQVDLDTDIRAITNQSDVIPVISFNVDAQSSLAVKLAQIQASDENPNIHIAAPGYPLKTGTHFNNVGYKRMGAYYGLVYKRIVIDGQSWEPLRPERFLRQGSLVQVKFKTDYKPLVIEARPVGGVQAAAGFVLTDPSNNPITIISVSVVNGDIIKIQAATTIPAGSKLTYQAGNIRDSQGNAIIFGGGGINFPLHNWSIVFQQTL